MTILYLARHGESDWNAANRFQGHSDRPLTELGRRQAEALAGDVAGLERPLQPSIRARCGGRSKPPPWSARGPAWSRSGSTTSVRSTSAAWSGLSRTRSSRAVPGRARRWLDGGEGWEDGETYDGDGLSCARRAPPDRGCPPGGRRSGRLPRRADPGDPGGRPQGSTCRSTAVSAASKRNAACPAWPSRTAGSRG